MRLFDPEGPLMTALGKLADIVICNIMFCVFSLPIFSAGAALTALYTAMQQLIEDKEDDAIFHSFWRAFKQNFKQATVLWLLCLAVVAFLTIYFMVISSLTSLLRRIYLVSFFLLCIVFLFGFQYLFPMQARFQNKIRYTIKNSWLLSVAALPWTLCSIVITVLAVYLTFFMNPNNINMGIFIWAVGGFGIVAYLNSFLFRRAFRKIVSERAETESTQPKEAVFTDESHRKDDLMIQESTYSNPNWNRREEFESKPESDVKSQKKRFRHGPHPQK